MNTAPKILVASDIFGMTGPFLRLVREIGGACVPVSAHADPDLSFRSEEEGYARFMEAGGVEPYARRILTALDADPAISFLVGFSAGASAAWIACADVPAARLDGAVLFYGSRIRGCAELAPRCPVRLVFAEREASFDPAPLVLSLAERGLDASLVRGCGHGFMNALSENFSPALYARFLTDLRGLVFSPESGAH